MTYDNELKGVLFKNDKKENDKHPDYKGNATINGVDYWMNCWINETKEGRKYLSHKFTPKDNQQSAPSQQTNAGQVDDFNDEIPFSPIHDTLI